MTNNFGGVIAMERKRRFPLNQDKYKHTSIGNSRNTRIRNKNKKRIKKVLPNGKPMYRGQGKWIK